MLAEGAVKPKSSVWGAAGHHKDDHGPFQALAPVALLTLWSAPSLVLAQLLAGS